MRLVKYRGRWYAAYRTASGTKRVALRTADRGEAERELANLLRKPQGGTVGALVESYLKEKEAQGARSIQGMRSAWATASKTFANLHPEHITRAACRDYTRLRRKAGKSDGTIIKELSVVRSGLRYHKADAGAVFELPHTPPPKERFLRQEEIHRIIEAAKLHHVKLFVRLAWATAGRASAILELTWDRVDMDRWQIRLWSGPGRRKGRATVPVPEPHRTALQEAYEARTSDYVIEWGGKPVKSVKKAFAEAVRGAGLTDVTPHTIRHSAAVAMAESRYYVAVSPRPSLHNIYSKRTYR